MMGATRRTYMWSDPDYLPWLALAMAGAALILAGFALMVVQIAVSVRRRAAIGRAARRSMGRARARMVDPLARRRNGTSPCSPTVTSRDAFYEAKKAGQAYRSPAAYEDIEVPRNTATAPLIGLFACAWAFGLVWHIWWLVGGLVRADLGGGRRPLLRRPTPRRPSRPRR